MSDEIRIESGPASVSLTSPEAGDYGIRALWVVIRRLSSDAIVVSEAEIIATPQYATVRTHTEDDGSVTVTTDDGLTADTHAEVTGIG